MQKKSEKQLCDKMSQLVHIDYNFEKISFYVKTHIWLQYLKIQISKIGLDILKFCMVSIREILKHTQYFFLFLYVLNPFRRLNFLPPRGTRGIFC